MTISFSFSCPPTVTFGIRQIHRSLSCIYTQASLRQGLSPFQSINGLSKPVFPFYQKVPKVNSCHSYLPRSLPSHSRASPARNKSHETHPMQLLILAPRGVPFSLSSNENHSQIEKPMLSGHNLWDSPSPHAMHHDIPVHSSPWDSLLLSP